MTAIEAYQARIDAVAAQRERRRGPTEAARWAADPWAGGVARRFRYDPHRPLDRNLAILASYVQPDDVVVDVGGGAGRICLPLALRCRDVIDVDPSGGMRAEFESLVTEAAIPNARYVQADWLETEGITGDVVLTANVTYFVREIERFVRKLEAAARRRVLVAVWSVSPPAQAATLYEAAFDEARVHEPSYRELLPVLWEMDILPDVRVLPAPWSYPDMPGTRDELIGWSLGRLGAEADAAARTRIEARFDTLYTPIEGGGYRALWPFDVREVLITWEPHQATV